MKQNIILLTFFFFFSFSGSGKPYSARTLRRVERDLVSNFGRTILMLDCVVSVVMRPSNSASTSSAGGFSYEMKVVMILIIKTR